MRARLIRHGRIALARTIGRCSWYLNSPLWFRSRYARHHEALAKFAAENALDPGSESESRIGKSHDLFRRFYSLNLQVQAAVALGDVEGARRVLRETEVEGVEKIEEHRGRGVIGFSYHVGPFSLLPLFLCLKGYSVNILVRPDILLKRSRMTIEEINEGLARFSSGDGLGRVTFIDAFSLYALMQMKKRLGKGELLFLYPDTVKDSSAEYAPIPFFDTHIAGHLGPARLFRMTGAAFLPFKIRWQPGACRGRMKISIRDPLNLSTEESDEEIIRKIYGGLETDIREQPEQWIQVDSYDQMKVEN